MIGRSSSRGLTLVELLVVISIIGLLVGLTLPAVQMAREAARRTTCQNHLRQIGLAVQHHHDAHRHYPTGGWGYAWVGEPDRGYGINQPGGWIFNILPFLEAEHVRNMAIGSEGAEKRDTLARMMQVTQPLFHCPSRRRAELYPFGFAFEMRNVDAVNEAAKTDYAINAGDSRLSGGRGPASAAAADVDSYAWPDLTQINGIAFVRSQFTEAHVRDGLSNTILAGEKFVSVQGIGTAYEDDQSLYIGDDADVRCFTHHVPVLDAVSGDLPDTFGSSHPAGCHFVFCDGSVRLIEFTIDPGLFRSLGNRHDRAPIAF